ncbi:MAG: hypothetical protein L0Y58_12405 [Verrucomicrobia subdivision 3 bacterium]|nr:hypothetical protein [Limisphaerales bacterium]
MKKSKWSATQIRAVGLLLLIGALSNVSSAAPGDVDLSFDTDPGVNGTVNAVVVQPDGKVIIGGQFTTVKGLLRTNLARLNADGSGDSTFTAAPPNAPVYSLALQTDGKVLVGGVYGVNSGLTRVNTDGSADTNFNANVYAAILTNPPYYGGQIAAIAVQPDGKVFYAGESLLRLNPNGTLDTNFVSAVGGVVSVKIPAMARQSDGKLIVSLYFYDNQNDPYGLVRLNTDGSLDNSFDPPPRYDGPISSIVVQPDGKVLVGGFGIGTNYACIARLNGNGTVDSTFAEATGPGLGGPRVNAIALQPDGKVIIGGQFVSVHGDSRTNLARLNPDGSLDLSFNNVGATAGRLTYPGTAVYAISSLTNGTSLIGGEFTMVNGANRARVARLNANGSVDDSFNPGRNVDGGFLVLQPDGKLLIGDVFTFINGTNRYARTRLNADGSVDSTFISDTNFRPYLIELNFDDCGPQSCGCTKYATPFGLRTQPDGKVLISVQTETFIYCPEGGGGYFVGHVLARFNADGSPDWSFGLVIGNHNSGGVGALAVQPDGKVVIGGGFTTVNGTNRYGIARLNTDGSLDGSFQNGMSGVGVRTNDGYSGVVGAVALQPDGKVLIGGWFTTVNGTNRNNIARLNADGSLDGSFNPGTGVSGQVFSISLQPDGKVLVGGLFTSVNGTNRNNIARLNANGSLDSSFNPGTGANGVVGSIALQSDGNVLIGGDFTTVNGVVRPRVARLYGDSIPSLSIARSNTFVIVSWPVTSPNFQLQENTNVSLSNGWSVVGAPSSTNSGFISATVPTTASRKFFRLSSP